ncbi:MAG: hypothetical protein C4551_08805 [Bacillota bacterium]|nr:MAG: hypothetical protein C4551_08805 [Bacillota bacterium]
MSRYRNAAKVLPPDLLAELQQYAPGTQLYVPRPGERIGWGERSGARRDLARRNEAIRRRKAQGATIEQLMAEFHLGHDSIRKILAATGPGGKNESSRFVG